MDQKIEDEDKAKILLCSLSLSFETLYTALTVDKVTIKLDIVSRELISHYERRQGNNEDKSHGDGLYANYNQEKGRHKEK